MNVWSRQYPGGVPAPCKTCRTPLITGSFANGRMYSANHCEAGLPEITAAAGTLCPGGRARPRCVPPALAGLGQHPLPCRRP